MPTPPHPTPLHPILTPPHPTCEQIIKDSTFANYRYLPQLGTDRPCVFWSMTQSDAVGGWPTPPVPRLPHSLMGATPAPLPPPCSTSPWG